MVNKRMKAAAVLRLVRKAARRQGLTVQHLPGRGKGSHSMYALVDQAGNERGRMTLTSNSKGISWTVLRTTEQGLEHLLGKRWMED